MVAPDTLLALALTLPWVVTAATLALGGRERFREATAVGGGAVLFVAVLALVSTVFDGHVAALRPVEFVEGVALSFRADAAGVLFAVVVSVLWPVASVYSSGYLRATGARSRPRFGTAFAASIGSVLGIAFAGNLLTLFVCYELLTVATYPLVVHTETETARRAGRKYAAFALGGGVAVLAGTALIYALTGTVAFAPGGIAGLATADPTLARAAFALLVAGFGVKAALMPLHGWLPDAMVAPTPVSALLHAVAVVKSGVFGIARVLLYVYGPDGVEALGVGLPLAVVATATMLLAGALALRQDRLKRGLAYSTVSQLSYIVLGLAVLTPAAVRGALLHLAAHAFMKIVLFFGAGVVYVETHVERIDQLAGVGRRLPATMAAFAVASAGLVGFPLVAGFVSKWHLLTGLFASEYPVFGVALLVAGLLKLLFFWPLIAGAFFTGDGSDSAPTARPVDTDGGHSPDDLGDDGPSPDGQADGGHPPDAAANASSGGWPVHSWRTETRWRLLLPVLVAVAVAVAFGLVPTRLPFYDLAVRVVEVTVS